MPPNGPPSEMAFEIKFAILQFRNLLFMLICLHLQGQRNWQHWAWDPGRKSSTKIQEMKAGLNHIRCTEVRFHIKQGNWIECLRVLEYRKWWTFPGLRERPRVWSHWWRPSLAHVRCLLHCSLLKPKSNYKRIKLFSSFKTLACKYWNYIFL